MTTAPYGSWESPIVADDVASAGMAVSHLSVSGGAAWWLESRPKEGGRLVLVRRDADGGQAVVTPEGFNVRTRVHEYGGGSFVLHDRTVWFSNFADQRLYRQVDGGAPEPVTPEPPDAAAVRYADGRVMPDGSRILCVRERHDGTEVTNEVVLISADGGADEHVVASGHDFYAAPRLSPDGTRVCWVSWDHPNMPWDDTELWLADLGADGSVSGAVRVAGGPGESVTQPRFGPDGSLYFASDRTGWWNLYKAAPGVAPADAEALCEMDAEFAGPAWTFGGSSYCVLDDGRVVCTYGRGSQSIGVIKPGSGQVERLETPHTSMSFVRADPDGEHVWYIGASATLPGQVVRQHLATGATEVVRTSREELPDPGFLSVPREIEFPTEGGLTAHALFHDPHNRLFQGPDGERPPLIVFSHGGPTGAASSSLNMTIQYFTSRGFAVVDVNYGGSTGYGRQYRERLKGTWGVTDVNDCVNAARYLAGEGLVDGERLAIRGGSAGGYTTLCALVFTDAFSAGASYFGVADAEALAKDTHKFESRYLDGLIGPYPDAVELYRERSPIHFTDRLSCPVIIFQGLEDKIVPPNQAEAMVAALEEKGIPHAYLAFEGEQHGFRKAENIKRTLEAELYFYSRVFGFEASGDIEPVEITPPI